MASEEEMTQEMQLEYYECWWNDVYCMAIGQYIYMLCKLRLWKGFR